jgi:hypothetical protein
LRQAAALNLLTALGLGAVVNEIMA